MKLQVDAVHQAERPERILGELTSKAALHLVAELCHTALQGMLLRGSGRIINVASVAAFANRGSYSAAKAWQVKFSRWANLAYAANGVKVTAVCPGFTHTEFHDRMGMDKTVAPRWLWLHADRVVREGLADNERGQAVSIPTRRYKLVAAISRMLPARLTAGPPKKPANQDSAGAGSAL